MRLTRFSDHALRCLIVLGLEPTRHIPVPEIAARTGASYDHLVKIVQRLSALGYVETERGRHGGVRLSIDPAQVTIGTIVRQTEENLALVACFDPDNHECPIASACRLAPILDDALTAFFAVLDTKSLADVLEPRNEILTLTRRLSSAS